MKHSYLTLLIFFFFLSLYCMGGHVRSVGELLKSEQGSKTRNDSTLDYFVRRAPMPRMQSLYFEFFGNSANAYSLNYEKCIYQNKVQSGMWNRYSIRIGLNYYTEKYAMPILFHFSRGLESFFEAGAGWVPWLSENKRVDGIAAFSGFRYQPYRSGLMARFALTPTYLIQDKKHWRMIFGFSFGWVF